MLTSAAWITASWRSSRFSISSAAIFSPPRLI
jgi:hypothetical protein